MMALPDVHFELDDGTQWVDHGPAGLDNVAFESSALAVQYGQHDEHGEAEPTDISCVLDNRQDAFSFADPAGAAWGVYGVGTRARVRVGDSQAALAIPGARDARAATPDSAALSITGDIDIRLDIEPSTWRPPIATVFAGKWAPDYVWVLYLRETGELRFAWSPTGAVGGILTRTSTAAIPSSSTRLAVRVTVDVNNGSGGHTVTFYTAPTINGSWTQLGSAVVTAGTTSFFDSTNDITIGTDESGNEGFANSAFVVMSVYAMQIRSGIGGTIVANPDFTATDPTDSVFTDSAGAVWTIYPTAAIVDRSVRGTGAAVSWLPMWDETGQRAEFSFKAAGLLEQFGHGSEPARSSLYRDISPRENVVAYWPLEDPSGSTSFEGGRPGVGPATPEGTVTPANATVFTASTPGVSVESGPASGVTGTVPTYTPSGRQRIMCGVSVPDSGVSATAQLLNFYCRGGSVRRMSINIATDGSLTLVMRDIEGNTLLTAGPTNFEMNGNPSMVSLAVEQVGSDIEWELGTFIEGRVSLGFDDGTLAGRSFGRFTSVEVGLSPNLNGTGFVHLQLINDDQTGDLWDLMREALVAWSGERALERQIRRCAESDVALMTIGDPEVTTVMGPQEASTTIDVFDKCSIAEFGRAGERRDAFALLSRSRESLYNQDPALTLDMREGVVINPFEVPFDTQAVRNSVTAARDGGSSYVATKTSGPKSTAPPPEGIGGIYPSNPQLNIKTDEQLVDQATFRLYVGTTEQPRVPKLELEMEHHEDLVDAILALRIGDIILLENAGDLNGMPAGDQRLMFLGSTDTFTDQTWHVALNCAPAEPWTVALIGDGTDEQRFDTDGSIVNSTNFVAGTSTTLSVSVTQGPLWTTDAGEFPIEIEADGVVLTATAVSGASSPQTFTVSSTVVNGVNRLIPQGSDVRLAHPAYIGL